MPLAWARADDLLVGGDQRLGGHRLSGWIKAAADVVLMPSSRMMA